jgi:ketosteroid isomerase-like protein
LVTTASGQQQPATDEAAIRSARGRSNAAIAKHDVAGIAAHWMPDVHIVTSTSAQGTGREVNGQRMAEQFKRRPDTVYVRTPSIVEVNAPWLVASERGEWTGRWTEPDGVVDIRGAYQAQWRKVDGVWLIQAELFVPTHCKGSAYCAKRP